MTTLIVVACGGAGAIARYLGGGWVQRRIGSELPTGTAAVNLTGSFALGLVVGSGLAGSALAAAAGVLAGFTTYSTWMVEVVSLAEEGALGRIRSLFVLAGMMAGGLTLAWLGLMIGRGIF